MPNLCSNCGSKIFGLRSEQQNKYYWGVLVKILAKELGYFPDEMHTALKMKFLRLEEKKLPIAKSTTRLDKMEWEDYMEQIRIWASRDLGIILPQPNEIIEEEL